MAVTTTAQEFIRRALRLLNVVEATEQPSADDLEDGLLTLNEMIDAWATERLFCYHTPRSVFDLAVMQPSYTIGPGADLNVPRPPYIAGAGQVFDKTQAPATEWPIDVMTDKMWRATSMKTMESTLIRAIYYEQEHSPDGWGRIHVWPVPTAGNLQLVLYLPATLTQFADLTTPYTFPPGYARAIRYNLCLELGPEYPPAVPSGDVMRIAQTSKDRIKTTNVELVDAGYDPALSRPRRLFNIYTGS